MTRGVLLAVLLLAAPGCTPRVQTAAWAVRTEIESPAEVERLCAEARAAGLDELLVQVRGRGDAYYKSARAPRAESLLPQPASFDPLASVLRDCGGLRIPAWMNVFFLWGGDDPPRDPSHVSRSRPEWILRDGDGRRVDEYTAVERALGWIEGIYADPAAPGYRDHFVELVTEVVENYAVSGVHLDFVRYPGPGYGQGGALGVTYENAWGFDPRWIPEGLRVPDLEAWLTGEMEPADRVLATAALLWADLRASQVTALVRAVRGALDGIRPGLELSAAVFPEAGSAFLTKGQDWRAWASEGLVDALFPMAYFGGQERVEAQLEAVRDAVRPLSPGLRLWAGLGAYLKDVETLREEAETARRVGYDGVCLFDAGSLMANSEGLGAYAEAAGGRISPGAREAWKSPPVPTPASTPGGNRLAALAGQAGGGKLPVAAAGGVFDARWSEFEAARARTIPRALERLREGVWPVPAWAEARGVFRYVHPQDGEARRREQRKICAEARARLVDGEDFASVAAELSQGGTRKLGGVLGRRYLQPGVPWDDVLRTLKPGEVSPVVEVSNGYWVYRLEAGGPPSRAAISEIPWTVRRQLFREVLSEELAGPSAGTSPVPGSGKEG